MTPIKVMSMEIKMLKSNIDVLRDELKATYNRNAGLRRDLEASQRREQDAKDRAGCYEELKQELHEHKIGRVVHTTAIQDAIDREGALRDDPKMSVGDWPDNSGWTVDTNRHSGHLKVYKMSEPLVIGSRVRLAVTSTDDCELIRHMAPGHITTPEAAAEWYINDRT